MREYTIEQGDCLELIKKIPDNSLDCILTDPPYGYLHHKLDRPFDEDALFEEWDRVLKDTGFIVVFGRGESFYRWNCKLNNLGFKFKEEIIWNKKKISSPVTPIMRVHETISVLSKKGSVKKNKIPYSEMNRYHLDRVLTDMKRVLPAMKKTSKSFKRLVDYVENGVFRYNEDVPLAKKDKITYAGAKGYKGPDSAVITARMMLEGKVEQDIIEILRDKNNARVHPTQKPVRLLERLLLLTTEKDDTVLDCFMGSGSTGVACMNLDRKFIGYEIDGEYFKSTKKRIEEADLKLV